MLKKLPTIPQGKIADGRYINKLMFQVRSFLKPTIILYVVLFSLFEGFNSLVLSQQRACLDTWSVVEHPMTMSFLSFAFYVAWLISHTRTHLFF